MKKTKEQKAITLIALIITIVVLLILAVVAINAVTGDGIIQHATNAKTTYENAQAKEQDILSYYESYLGGTIGKWTQSGDILKKSNSDGTVMELRIGDKIEYDEGYDAENLKTSKIDYGFVMKNLEWRVLGVNEQGQLELISTQPTDSTLELTGQEDWIQAEEKLDTLCNDLYGKGEGAQSARSLKLEDIDEIAGIITEKDKRECRSEYSSIWQYRYSEETGYIQYRNSTDGKVTWGPSVTNNGWEDTTYQIFTWPDKGTIDSSNYKDENGEYKVIELAYTSYGYTVSGKVSLTTQDGILISDLITKGLNDSNNLANDSYKEQWLSSRTITCFANPYGNVNRVNEGNTTGGSMFWATGDSRRRAHLVRPVVTLKFDAKITDTNNDGILEVKK